MNIKNSIGFFLFIFTISCGQNNVIPSLIQFKQTERNVYNEKLGINWKYEINELKSLSQNKWKISIEQNLAGGLCEDNYNGKILIRKDTIYLLADYLYNEPEYKDVWVEAPVNNCTSIFEYTISGIENIYNFEIIFENEISKTPVSNLFLN